MLEANLEELERSKLLDAVVPVANGSLEEADLMERTRRRREVDHSAAIETMRW